MASVTKFEVRGMTSDKYDELVRRLKKAGAAAPPGRLYHICYGDRANLQVIDVYESPQAFESFGQTLMPILDELGIKIKPDIKEVYNTSAGLSTDAEKIN